MAYASFPFVSFLVVLIVNFDIFNIKANHSMVPAYKEYRRLLEGIMFFYVTDILWGIFDEKKMMTALYIDTVFYFIAMAVTVICWTRFVIKYLSNNNWFETLLRFIGQAFAVFVLISLAINFYKPIFFRFDSNNVYQALTVRAIVFVIQIGLFLTTSIYTFLQALKIKGKIGLRHLSVGLFGVEEVFLIGIQVNFPLIPLYTIGCLLGTCVFHTFVLETQKNEYQQKLERLLEMDQAQKKEINDANMKAYRDSLTGVKSKTAYMEEVQKFDGLIKNKEIMEFGVVAFDLNDLKTVNDTLGHEAGDKYIKDGCMVICKTYAHSPVFRIGGDEFAAIIQGADYQNRDELILKFENQMEENNKNGEVVVSSGMAIYNKEEDTDYSSIFERADKKMYERKRLLKGKKNV